jgi:hypothetical protein
MACERKSARPDGGCTVSPRPRSGLATAVITVLAALMCLHIRSEVLDALGP